jgi:hypothetical protein
MLPAISQGPATVAPREPRRPRLSLQPSQEILYRDSGWVTGFDFTFQTFQEDPPEHWLNEEFELRKQVYNFQGGGTADDPAVLSDQYLVQARRIALQRAAIAA